MGFEKTRRPSLVNKVDQNAALVAETAARVAANLLKLDRDQALNSKAVDYTLLLTDVNKVIQFTKATAQVLTVPLNAAVAFPIGTVTPIIQTGAGSVTVAGDIGVTVSKLAAKTLVVGGQYGEAKLRKIAADVWLLTGDLVAA